MNTTQSLFNIGDEVSMSKGGYTGTVTGMYWTTEWGWKYHINESYIVGEKELQRCIGGETK